MALEVTMSADASVLIDAGHSGGPITCRFPSYASLPSGTRIWIAETGNDATSVTFASHSGDSPAARVMNPSNRTAAPAASVSGAVQMKSMIFELRKDEFTPDDVPQWFCWWCV